MLTPNQFPLIIFDWDGTLMDSVPRIVASMQTLAAQSDLPIPTIEAVHDIIGLSLPIALERLFDAHDAQQQQRLLDIYRDIYVVRDTTPTPMFSGATHLLGELRGAGYTLAVATGKARPGLERAWVQSQTKAFFSASRCAQEVASKPHPQMLNEILTETGVSADRALMVGDSIHDMEMARNAQVSAIGVTYGVHSAARLAAAKPKYTVDSIAQLRELLLSEV